MKQDRYSEELLECARFLLTVEDPICEQEYGSGLHRVSAEPSETLAIIRDNARVVRDNIRNGGYGPVIPEDLLFLKVEASIRWARLKQVDQELADVGRTLIWAAAVGAVALLGLQVENIVRLLQGLLTLAGIVAGGLLVWWAVRRIQAKLLEDDLQELDKLESMARRFMSLE